MNDRGVRESPDILVLVGPTASGKTEISLELARTFGGEIVNADSRQVYQGLTVGTAKPSLSTAPQKDPLIPREAHGVPHYVIDFLDPRETFNAGDYSRIAGRAVQAILKKGKKPIVVGGTGLYIRALIDGIAPLPGRDEGVRKKLKEWAEVHGNEALHERLSKADPDGARNIHPRNTQRVIRALEVHELTGVPLSVWHAKTPKPNWKCLFLGVSVPKDELEKRIERRTETMLDQGMIEETQTLLQSGCPKSAPGFEGLGYRSVMDFLDGKIDRNELKQKIIHDTKAYAKRQLTWFKVDKRISWLRSQDVPSFLASRLAPRPPNL